MIRTATILAALALATPALADPCKAIPDRGPMPSYLSRGATFSGPVTYVGDGDSLCVAVGQGAANWVEVRVEDFYAPELNAPGGREAKQTLTRLAYGKRAVCVAGPRVMTASSPPAASTACLSETSCEALAWSREGMDDDLVHRA